MRLLDRARDAGLAVWAQGSRLALEGPESAEALALELLANEPEVLADLARERARREAEAPFAMLPASACPERPPPGWTCTGGVWIGPTGELSSPQPDSEESPGRSWEDAT